MPDYYVYGLFRPDTGAIFYVGMGQGDRASQHAKYRRRGRSHKDNLLCKLIDDDGYSEIPVIVFREGLTRAAAADLEIALIYAIGRHPYGPLTNVVRGGEGLADPTPEFRLRHGRRMQEVLSDPAIRAVMSEKARSRERTPEFEASRAAAGRTPESRAKKSAAAKARERSPEFEAVRLASVTSPEAKAKRKASMGRRAWITDGQTDQYVRADAPIPEGWRRGRPKLVPAVELERRAEAQRVKREAWLSRNRRRIWISNGIGEMRLPDTEPIPDGWRRGRLM